jgi:hypothetical protein
VAPIGGGGDPELARLLRDTPLWAFHGGADRVVSPYYSRAMIDNAHADPVDSDSCFPDTTTVFGRPQDRERRRGIRAYQGGEGPSRPDPPRVLSSCRGNGGTSVRKTTSWAAIVLALCTGVGAFEFRRSCWR